MPKVPSHTSHKNSDEMIDAFICYSHIDRDEVYFDISVLKHNDINVWYDQGISAGQTWQAEIAGSIKRAKNFLFYISKHSLQSTHCLREVDFAISNNIKIVPIYLDSIELPEELQISLNRIHALDRKTDIGYEQKLLQVFDVTSEVYINPVTSNVMRLLSPIVIASVLVFFAIVLGPFIINNSSNDSAISDTLELQQDPFKLYSEGISLIQRWDIEGNVNEAIKKYETAITLKSDFGLAFARLGEAYRMKYSLTRHEEWLNMATNSIAKAISLNTNLAITHVANARIKLLQGNIDIAYSSAQKAISLDPSNAHSNQAMALVLQKQGRIDEAVTYFEKAASLAPEDVLILDSFANFMYDLDEFEKAAELWNRALAIVPDHFAVLVNLGAVMVTLGNYTDAIDLNQQAISIRPSYMAYLNLGLAYSESNQAKEAIQAYKQAIDIEDSDWLVWGNMSALYFSVEGFEDEASYALNNAIDLAEVALKNDPRDYWASSDLAIYYSNRGEDSLARKRISTALALIPDLPSMHVTAAQVYQKLSDNELAKQHIQKALELGYSIDELRLTDEFDSLLLDYQ